MGTDLCWTLQFRSGLKYRSRAERGSLKAYLTWLITRKGRLSYSALVMRISQAYRARQSESRFENTQANFLEATSAAHCLMGSAAHQHNLAPFFAEGEMQLGELVHV